MNKKVRNILIIIGIVILCVCGYFIFHKSVLYKKLQGSYNPVPEYMYIVRNVDFKPLSLSITFNKSKVELPVIQLGQDGLTHTEIKQLMDDSKGTWEIISENPDSILIETPKSLLNGKYAVFFKKEHPFGEPVSYLLILQNDSTRFGFSKIVLPYPNMEWE